MRSRKDDGGLSALAVVVAVFLVSATAAAVFNHEGNAGAKVAVVASRFDRQVDDTRAAFTDIRELIPEQKNLAAVSPESYANESTSGNNSEFKYASPNDSSNDSSNVAMPSGVRRVAKVGANAVENRGHEHVHPVLQEPVRVEAITEYDDLTSPCRWDFSWRAWRPLKRRPPAAPRQCRAAEHSPNATTKTRNERPGRTGSGHEITSE